MGSGTKRDGARGRPKPPDRILPPPGSGRRAQSVPSHHSVTPSASADHVLRPLSGRRARRTSSTRDFRLPRRRHALPPFTDSKTPSFVAARNPPFAVRREGARSGVEHLRERRARARGAVDPVRRAGEERAARGREREHRRGRRRREALHVARHGVHAPQAAALPVRGTRDDDAARRKHARRPRRAPRRGRGSTPSSVTPPSSDLRIPSASVPTRRRDGSRGSKTSALTTTSAEMRRKRLAAVAALEEAARRAREDAIRISRVHADDVRAPVREALAVARPVRAAVRRPVHPAARRRPEVVRVVRREVDREDLGVLDHPVRDARPRAAAVRRPEGMAEASRSRERPAATGGTPGTRRRCPASSGGADARHVSPSSSEISMPQSPPTPTTVRPDRDVTATTRAARAILPAPDDLERASRGPSNGRGDRP